MTARRVGVLLGGWGEDEAGSVRAGEAIAAALARRGHQVTTLSAATLDESLPGATLDVAFLALQGRMAEDGLVQSQLQELGLPFTGAGALASALAMNKGTARRLFRHFNLATPAGYVVPEGELDRVESLHGDLGFPCVVKPALGSGDRGASLVLSVGQLRPAVVEACRFGGEALVERYVKGREVTVALLDGEVLGTCEVSHGRAPGSARLHQPPRLSPTRVANLEAMALTAWRALGCRGVALVDFICPEVGNEVLLGVSTQPALAPTALLPRIARANGVTFDELCERLLDAAALDGAEVSPLASLTRSVGEARHAS